METKTIDIKKLKDFLAEYLPSMDEQKTKTMINAGGCGFFAYELSKVLDKMNVPHEIVALWDLFSCGYDETKNYVAGKGSATDCGVGHCVVKIDDTFFDAMGITDKDYVENFKNELAIKEELLPPMIHNDHWNDIFDKKEEPEITKYLHDIPKAFENWTPGKYTHKYQKESEKPLNYHTKSSMRSSW